MRVIKLASGLVVALAGAGANEALANDVSVSTATTTPLVTSSPDGVSPGDVTVTSTGSIEVAAGETAITVDSSNDVSVAGQLTSEDADNSTGILLQGGNSGTITLTGGISLTETYLLEDTDEDGDLDGAFATGTNRNGIWLQAGPTFTGDIIQSGAITIEGQNSAGIRLDALLTGDLTSSGLISIVGENSYAIAINGGAGAGVTGDVLATGGAVVRGENSGGILVDAPIGGELSVNGAWQVTGYHSTLPPEDVSILEAEDLLAGSSAIEVRYSVAGGITIEGIGVEDDEDDDGDGVTETAGDTDDDLSATVLSTGPAPALLIQADPSANLVLGATDSGYGLHVRGSVTAAGVYEGFDATAIRIEGSGGSTVTTANGVALDNLVLASSVGGTATGVYIGNNAIVPNLLIRRFVAATGSSESALDAYAVFLDVGANLPNIENSGIMRTQFFGETGNATVIEDRSNTLATITNSGTIEAVVIATDDDSTDDIPAPPVTGSSIAIDVSASTIDVTFSQIADVPFTDDDAVDDDVAVRPDILTRGDILFGSGNDTLNLFAGEIDGDISFGAGNDLFVIDNGTSYSGQITDSDGALTINVVDGVLSLNGGALDITSATFDADAQLGVLLSNVPAESTFIEATGTITFAPGARIVPVVPEGLPASGTQTFLTANGGLVGAANVTGAVTGEGVPWLYNLNIDVAGNSLEADYALKTPVELNLTANQTAAFDPILTALRLDEDAAAAMSSLDTEYEFFDAYEDLLPSYSSAATELLATAVQQSQSATTNRLATTRLQGLNDVSVWAQEIAYGLNRDPETRGGQKFRGQGFGFAGGIDGPLNNGGLFGLSGSFVTSQVEEPGRPDGEISAWVVQGNAYLGAALGPVDLDFIGGLGFGQLSERRFVEIGDSFSALSEADWWTYEGHVAARASLPLALTDWLVITPQAALTYVYMNEEGYTESGGGVAIDYEADSASSQRLWADVGAELSARFTLRGGGRVAPRIYAGYRANAIDEGAERSFRFVSGGSSFTLTDESLGSGGALFGLGLDATNGYSTVSIGYEGEFSDQIDRHSLNAAVRFRF